MFEPFEKDYAAALSERAHLLMQEHEVSFTPVNFALWYNYARNSSPELRQAIDDLIDSGSKFEWEICGNLFLRHIAPTIPDRSDSDLPISLNAVMSHAKQFLTEAISANRDQVRKIGEVAERVEQGVDPVLLVQALAEQLSHAAMHAARLEKNLDAASRELDSIRHSLKVAEERARIDVLTGLANRQAVEEFLKTSMRTAFEADDALGLLLLDVDHFKKFNDDFGHGVGDQVLRHLSGILRQQLRQTDLPGRFGGEELIAVLPGATLKTCEMIAERIRLSIAECKITRRSTGEMLPRVTASIGVAQWRSGEAIEQLLDRCDKALYLAKRTGRNRVVSEQRLEGQRIA
jgi:diguanylate cyclase